MTRSRAVEVAAGSGAVPEPVAFTGAIHAGRFHEAATVVGRVRHIPSQVAQGVPDIQLLVVPVVRATQSRAEGIIGDTDTVRRR